MTPDLHALHVAAGLRAGREHTCAKKIPYSSEESATKAKDTMLNQNPAARNAMEAHPCGFCKNWHVGLKMSDAELRGIAYAPFSTDELAHVPTSLLLLDVIAHACDRFDGDQLCDRCRGKWAELDLRLPARTVKP